MAARKGSTAEVEAPENTEVTEAPVEATETTEEVVDLTAFEAAVAEVLPNVANDDVDYGPVKSAFTDLGRKGKAQARTLIQDRMRQAIGDNDLQTAQAYLQVQNSGLEVVRATKEREPKAPVDPTADYVTRLATAQLAYQAALGSAPEGVAADAADQATTIVGEKMAQLESLISARQSGSEEPAEVDDMVKRAVRFALAGSGSSKRSSGGDGTSYNGPRRSVGNHIREAIEGMASGEFLSVAGIAGFKSGEYGDDRPSAGAISSALKSAQKSGNGFEGVTVGEGGPKGTLGITKA